MNKINPFIFIVKINGLILDILFLPYFLLLSFVFLVPISVFCCSGQVSSFHFPSLNGMHIINSTQLNSSALFKL